jgi:hypothetical protein
MQKRILCYAVACLLSLNVFSQYIYEGNQSLIDLTNQSGTTNLNSGDDQVSNAFNLGFNFDFYNQTFSSARMATNGCLHFKTSGAYCSDYTPDPLANQYTYTMLPFWTDLIRDNGSKMLAKSFNDMTVFGWYDMREYNRASDNSFEVILWTNNTFEYRYGALDIINHDVLIGEVGSGSSEIYQYLFHDECNTGSTNSSSCVNTNWNDTSFNDMLENGGSLYGSGSGNNIDCSNPLNNSSCSGYAAAYQTQQCDIDQLYSESCPYYWDAYDDLQCDLDPQYAPFCQGYSQENSVAYFEEEFDYGYQEEYDMYDTFEEPEIFEEYVFEFEYDFFEEPELIFTEEIIFEQLQPLDEFIEPLPFIREEEIFLPIEDLMIEEFVFQETFIEEMEEWFEEETIIEEELAYAEESEEELIEELVEEEEVIEEEIQEDEELVIAEETSEGKSSISREMALNVISSTLNTAQASVSGTTSGNSIHSTGGTTGASSVSSSNSGGVSISNSPSISEQFASSTAQNNQVLAMSSNITSSTSVEAETVETTSVVVDTTTTQTLQSQIDVSISTDASATETEQTVANVIAQNLQAAQDDVEAKQEETGEYGSENTIIAYMGFVPNFNNYRLVTLPDQDIWYESKDIYANNMLTDNIEGFYQMAGQSLETLIEMRQLQPPL